MTLHDAEAVCASQNSGSAWEYIVAHSESFIWSDDEEPVNAWNRLFAAASGPVAVKSTDDREVLSFRDRIVVVQSEFNRDDRFRILHGLARVVRPESDLRLCRDSTHSSDVAFFAMPPIEWKDLESKFGADRVAAHFLSMDSAFDEFLKAAFPVPETKGGLSPDWIDWEGGSSYQPHKLDYRIVWDGPGQLRLDALRTLIHRYLEIGVVTVSFCGSKSRLSIDRDALLQTVANRIGAQQIRVSNSTQTGFIVVEQNGVAAGWRTDGWLPQDEASPKWWRLRK
jgi:hypothetical protein